MKKILVTGATGFVGQYVVEALLSGGQMVIASSMDGEKARKASWYGRAGVSYIPLDFSRLDPAIDYFRALGAPDVMIHLAWEGLPHYKEAFHVEVNYPRHAALLENMVRNGLQSLTVIGTCLEYGMQEGALGEDLAARPGNPYALAKDKLRRRLEELQTGQPFSLKWVRLFYMWGKGQSPKSLISQLDKALEEGAEVFNMSGGEQERDYLPVEEVAAYIVRIALQQEVEGIINCCSGQPVRVKDFVEDYLRRHHKKINLNLGYYPYPDYEPMRFWGKNTKLKTILKDE